MKKILMLLCFPAVIFAQSPDTTILRKLYTYYLTESKSYKNLEKLCTTVGHRLSGSPQAEQAVLWAKKAMQDAGADTVFLQPCMVPHWVRGKKEKCSMTSGNISLPLAALSLGSSIGTGEKGIKAAVIEVSSYEDLEAKGKLVEGKIVFYNVFFDQSKIYPMHAYSAAVKFRSRGASYAAKYGAVACVLRSMTSVADDEPHTGNMVYDTTISKKKIPVMALSYVAADRLHEGLMKDKTLQLFMESYCLNLPPAPSFNVVGQINGTKQPDEFIITGGHLDSWDVGQGAQDDGAGVAQSIEILAAYKKLGIKPLHSIRAVAFMNEENGSAGGAAYAKWAKDKKEKHIAALETDAGGYTPRGFGVDTLNGLYKLVSSWKPLLSPYLLETVRDDGGGTDLQALELLGVPAIGFEPDNQRYFDIHHSPADTFDKVNKRELDLGAAAIGALLYLIDTHY